MRSSQWEYSGYVLIGVGIVFLVSGTITLLYFQEHKWTNPRYSSYPIPLLVAGACLTAIGVTAFVQSRRKRQKESMELGSLPPPPPSPPPPFPPPPPPPEPHGKTGK